MKPVIIFDLAEVLIAGLPGVEKVLSQQLSIPEAAVLGALGGNFLYRLCCGETSEDEYLSSVIAHWKWNITSSEIKPVLRLNFRRRIEGMDEILNRLVNRYELFLLSDHAREWVEYIHDVHPFLKAFNAQYFSYELKQVKQEPSTFTKILKDMNHNSHECLFIDDSQKNIDSATSAGVTGIRFKNARQLMSRLNQIGIT